MRYSVVSNLANSSSNPKDALGTILLLFRQKPYEYPFSSNSPFKSWHISAIFSILPSFHLPGFHFSLSGKYFLVFPLAWIPFFLLRQVFPRLSTCLDCHFCLSGKYFPVFPLAWIPFFPLRQVFSRLSTCLDSVFPSQASISSPFHLPGFHFFLSGKWNCLGNSVPFVKIHFGQLVMTEICCLNSNNQKEPVVKRCLYVQNQTRTVNFLIISLSKRQIRKCGSDSPPPVASPSSN